MATAVPSPTSSATTMSSGSSSLGSSPSQTLSTSQQAASFALLLKAKGLVERDFLTAMQSHTTAPGAGFKITDEEILAKLWATCKTGRQLSIAVARTLRVFRLCHPPEQKRLKQGYPVVSPMPALTDPARLSLPFSEKEEVDYLARALCIELKLPLQKRNIERQREHAVTKRQKRKAAKAAAKKRVMGSQAPTPSLQLSLPNPPVRVMGAQAPAPSLQPSLPNPKSNSLPLGAGALVAPSASAASLSLSLMAAPSTRANDDELHSALLIHLVTSLRPGNVLKGSSDSKNELALKLSNVYESKASATGVASMFILNDRQKNSKGKPVLTAVPFNQTTKCPYKECAATKLKAAYKRRKAEGASPNDCVFINARSKKPLTTKSANSRIQQIAGEKFVAEDNPSEWKSFFTLKSARKTVASHMAHLGCAPQTVASQLKHGSIQSQMSYVCKFYKKKSGLVDELYKDL